MACASARPRHGQCNDRKQSCRFRVAGDAGVPDVESPCFRIGEKAFNPPSLAIRTERIFRREHICGNQQQPAIAEFPPLEAQSVFRPAVHAWEPARPLPGARLAQKQSKLESPAILGVNAHVPAQADSKRHIVFNKTGHPLIASKLPGPRAGLQLMTLQTNEDAVGSALCAGSPNCCRDDSEATTSKAL